MEIIMEAVKLSLHAFSQHPMVTITMAGVKLSPHPLSLSPMGIIMEEISRPAIMVVLTVVN